MANDNLQLIKLGAPSRIIGGAAPNAELSVQFMGLCEELTLKDGVSKCTKGGALKTAAMLIKRRIDEPNADVSDDLSIQPLPFDFVLNGGSAQLHCVNSNGDEVKCVWQVSKEYEVIGDYNITIDGVITVGNSSFCNIYVNAFPLTTEKTRVVNLLLGGCNVKLHNLIQEYPSLEGFIRENPELISCVCECPILINSLIDTGKKNRIIQDNAYITTPYVPKEGFAVETIYIQDKTRFGVVHNNNGAGMWFCVNTGNNVYLNTYNSASIYIPYVATGLDGKKLIVEYNKQLSIDNYLRTCSISTPNSSHEITLFGIFDININTVESSKASESYYYKFYQDNVLIGHYVPFIRNGIVGMIDLVDLSFHPKEGNGNLTIVTE